MHALEYYTAIKKSMPFVVTWMDLRIAILSEVRNRERQILYGIIYT